ncbi:MAG TPA: hypothetical protein VIG40_05080 [Tissierellaceae bacterium]
MIIHIGENISLFKEDIISIFDVDSINKSDINKALLNKKAINKITDEIKSYILVDNKDGKTDLYVSGISSESLMKRSNMEYVDWRKVNVK